MDALDEINKEESTDSDQLISLTDKIPDTEKTIWLQCQLFLPPDFDPTNPETQIRIKLNHAFFGAVVLGDLKTMQKVIGRYLASIIKQLEDKVAQMPKQESEKIALGMIMKASGPGKETAKGE